MISLEEFKADHSRDEVYLKVSETIFFNPEKGDILYDTDKILSLTDTDARLFGTFLKSPDFFLSNKDMECAFGREGKSSNDSWRAQKISCLRDSLTSIPEITIENKRGRGYWLKVHGGGIDKSPK